MNEIDKSRRLAPLLMCALAACAPLPERAPAPIVAETPSAKSPPPRLLAQADPPAAEPAPETAPEPAQDDTCGAAQLQFLVGQTRAAAMSIAREAPMRVLGPTDMMTMDFRQDRVNVILNEENVVTRVYCG